jgi:hypothetical protein
MVVGQGRVGGDGGPGRERGGEDGERRLGREKSKPRGGAVGLGLGFFLCFFSFKIPPRIECVGNSYL